MKKFFAPVTLVAALAISACTPQDGSNLGLLAGAGGGLLLADAFGANTGWTIAATVAGAAVGQQIGRNSASSQCLYHAGYDSSGRQVVRQGAC